MAGMEVEELPEEELWAIEEAMQAAERFQSQDASAGSEIGQDNPRLGLGTSGDPGELRMGMAGMETEDLPEKELWAIENAIQAAERFQAQDASFLPGHEGHGYSSYSTHEMCRVGRALMEAAAMGCVPRLRKERMGPMASEVWGQEELLKLMVPCKSKRCCGSDDGSDVHSQEDEEVSCQNPEP